MVNPFKPHIERNPRGKSNIDREVVQPVPDRYARDFIPYRGDVDHGQKVGPAEIYNRELNEAMWKDEPEPDNEPEDKSPDPIPVRIVQSGKREIKSWRASRAYASSEVSRIVGRNDSRTSLRIKNLGKSKVWIGEDAMTAATHIGYPLPVDSDLTLSAIEDVWAVTEPTTETVNDLPNSQPKTTTDMSNGGSGVLSIVAAPWNAARTAAQLNATGGTSVLIIGPRSTKSYVAGQVVQLRVKVESPTSTTYTVRMRVRSLNHYIYQSSSIVPVATAPFMEHVATITMPFDVAANDLDIVIVSGGAATAGDLWYAGDFSLSTLSPAQTSYADGDTADDSTYTYEFASDGSSTRTTLSLVPIAVLSEYAATVQ